MFKSMFDEQRVVERTAFLQLASVYGLSALRDIQTKTGNAAITHQTADGEFKLSTGGGNSRAVLDSAVRIPYGPGTELEPGMGGRLGSVPTGGQQFRFGIFDDDNGFFREYNSDGLDIVVRKGGTEQSRTLWGKWNDKKVIKKGSGGIRRRGRVIHPLDAYIYTDPFAWYGYGSWLPSIQDKNRSSDGFWMWEMGEYRPSGGTSLKTPHLPLRLEVSSDAGDDNIDFYVGGRQVSIVGDYQPPQRETPVSTDVGTVSLESSDGNTWTGVHAVRRRSGAEYALTRLLDGDVLADNDVELALCLNPTIPNTGNWDGGVEHLSNDETKLEENKDPGDIDLMTAEWLTKFRVKGAGRNKASGGGDRALSDLPLIENKPYVLAARAIGTEGGLGFTGQWVEQW